jgi:adenosyl cobinamide kinase/adenosyl cobinamide phosphate guanylyltransferase
VSFIATAEPLDEEMKERIRRHQQERPPGWETLEAPLEVPQALGQARHGVVLLDCLTLWVSNLLLAGRAVEGEVERLLEVAGRSGKTLIAVSNEVGMGLVPENPLGRRYRDLLGAANQRLAQEAQEVYLLVAGLSLRLK